MSTPYTVARRCALPLTIGCLPVLTHAQALQNPAPDEEVIVIGTPRHESVQDLAQSVTVLSDEALERARSLNLGETLAGELGVNASYFGAGASRPVIRGLAGTRVRTMEDGIDAMDVSTISVDHAVSIDPLAAEQIEIFRGPTTLLYGSGAVGGVINTVTRRIPESAPDDGLAGAFEIRGDSALGERGGSLRLDGGGDGFAWHLDGVKRNTDNYEIPGPIETGSDERPGVLPNSDLETTSGAFGTSWLGESSFFGGSVSQFETNYGSPTEEVVRVDLEQTRIDLKGGWMGFSDAIEGITLRFGSNDYEHVEIEDGETGTIFKNQGEELRLEILASPWGEWLGSFGMQLQDRQFEAIGEEAFVPPVETTNLGVFTVQQRDLGDWNLLLGGRVESQRHKPTAPGLLNTSDTAGSVSVGGTRQLANDRAFVTSIAIAQRLPVAEELYAFGPHLASGTFEIGDPTLSKETSRHVDFGLRKTTGISTWGVTAFYTSFADFVFTEATGEVEPGEEEDLPVFAYTQQGAHFHGIEAEFARVLGEIGSGEVDARVYGDYTLGELDNGSFVPRMPPLRIGARVQFHNERLLAGLEATRYDKQDNLGAFETPTNGYTMVNADAAWALDASHRFHLFAKATNLLDEDARRSTSLVKDIAPLPGRSLAVGLRASF
jgi:iron complex outermembrane receptor protein